MKNISDQSIVESARYYPPVPDDTVEYGWIPKTVVYCSACGSTDIENREVVCSHCGHCDEYDTEWVCHSCGAIDKQEYCDTMTFVAFDSIWAMSRSLAHQWDQRVLCEIQENLSLSKFINSFPSGGAQA